MADTVGQNAHGYDHDNLRHVVITSTCFAFILSTTAVGFRIISRAINGNGLFLDDWFILLALVFEYGISIAGVVLLYNGLGTHIGEVTPEQLVTYLKTLFTGSILYTCCILFIKLSILALYRRLFPIKSMKVAVNVTSLIVILWAACGILAGCFTCIPTEKLWNPMIEGGCMNLSKFYYGLQIPNIATDAIILVMPMPVVWKLPISKAQKMGLSAIFVLGLLTLAFDIVRLVVLIELASAGADVTYNQVPASVWTCIEPAVGIVAACLANMRPLFKLMHTKVWSRISSRYATNSNNSSGSQINEKASWPRRTPSPQAEHNHSVPSSPSTSDSHSSPSNQSPTHNQSAV
ncbi:hypothetical protein N7452_006393 [Penicillium brevicompactum]|uniref:Rhodopsin domain-containing protein n=1 Tax=Penicillium brevicompactum TaxID=5074 RepID=A0A9W9UHH6_PENBR|nr:hypothetical protein N7452_006393 [Penicillium brevicompactum]